MKAVIVALAIFLHGSISANALELSGYVAAEGFYFLNDPLYDGQESQSVSAVIQPEIYHEFDGGSSLTFVPFGRWDSADDERTHMDIREAKFIYVADSWEGRIGVDKVYWGVTEFSHLVDIINQTDYVESIDGEEKLGQPMISFSLPTEIGVFDVYLLPYFRERTFPGVKGRLRTSLVVDTENPEYEHDDKENHVDYAARYSHSVGDWDFGISYFTGTSRDPSLEVRFEPDGAVKLVPYYEQIQQIGMELQYIAGSWLWKIEGIYRAGQGEEDYYATDAGFEYTFYQVFGTGMDVGALMEYMYDERGEKGLTIWQNDVGVGARLVLNDEAGSEALIGLSVDLDNDGKLLFIEASRRFGQNIRLYVETGAMLDIPEENPLFSIREDDYLRVELAYFY